MKHRIPIPPKKASKLLSWFLRDDLAEEVLGDLDEKFFSTIEKHAGRSGGKSLRRAKLNYWYQVLNYLRPFAIRKSRSINLNNYAMLQNYLKISWRGLYKQKSYSFINIGGLATGMSVAILLSLWLNDELLFNKHHENYDRLVQVMRHNDFRDEIETGGVMVPGLAELLRTSYPNEFEKVALVRWSAEENIFTVDNHNFTQQGYFIQPEIPEMFSMKMIHGSRNGLKDKNSVLLSQSLAEKLFGEMNPVNQIVSMNATINLLVTGVFEDLPHNSVLRDASYFGTIDLYVGDKSMLNVWDNYYLYIYAQLREGVDMNRVSELIKDAMMPHVSERTQLTKPELFLLPMSDWHLYSQFENGKRVTSERLKFVWLYGAIALFVLLLACINFMNLSTARSEKRAKEIGIRKSIGSTHYQLIGQFLTESLLVAIFAFGLSMLMVRLILPWFNEIAGKELALPLGNPLFWAVGLGFTLITGLLAGSYPAFYLSSFNSIKSLKGTYQVGRFATLVTVAQLPLSNKNNSYISHFKPFCFLVSVDW